MTNPYKSNIWKMYLVTFIRHLTFLGGVLIPFFVDWGGLNFKQILFLQSWFAISIFVLEVPTGVVADKWGRKHSIILGTTVAAFGAFLYASIPNFYIFMLAEFIFAIGYALISGADEALIYDSLKKIRKTKMAKKIGANYRSYGLLGMVIAAPIGSFIGVNFGLQWPMFLEGIVFLMVIPVLMTIKEPVTSKKQESERYLKIMKTGLKYFAKHRILKILTFNLIAVNIIGLLTVWIYQGLLKGIGFNILYFGTIHAVFVIFQIIIIKKSEFFEKLLGSNRRFLTFSSWIGGMFCILAAIFVNNLLFILAYVFIGGGFLLSRSSVFFAYLNKFTPSKERATILSAVSMIGKLGWAFAGPVMGYIIDFSFSYALLTMGIVAIIVPIISRVEESMLG